MSPKAKIKIISIALIFFFSFLIYKAVESSLVCYLTVSEAVDAQSFSKIKRLRVSGIVESGSITRNEDGSISFNIKDADSMIHVQYKGVIPDIFKDEIEAVVEGSIKDDTFFANKLFAKCPTKYEDEKLVDSGSTIAQ